jgi:chromate transporter
MPAADTADIDMPRKPLDAGVSWREAFWTWARIAALSFGGPAGQIAVMHRILVEEKRWIGETRFLHALNYCMLLPGPEAHELAIYIGWLMHRVRGGLLAGILFVLPGLVTVGLLSWAYAVFGHVGVVQGLFFGLKAAVLAVVIQGVLRVGKRALKNTASIAIAAAAFVALFVFAAPFPVIVIAAALIGFVGGRIRPEWFAMAAHGSSKEDASPALIDEEFARGLPEHVRPSLGKFARAALIGGAVWLAPLALLLATLGTHNVFTEIAGFNSKMAVVTFGGAYAVLAYMAQQAVERYHWLKPGEMLVGLGFAETTPGPLICVVQFVGFMAAFRQPGHLDPVLAGFAGGLLAMWSTFVPPFIWIFLGGPYVEGLIGNKALNAALSAVTAAVVGVILNLAIWFSLHTLFSDVREVHGYGLTLDLPVPASVNWQALVLSAAALVAMLRFKTSMLATLAACSLAGIALYLLA